MSTSHRPPAMSSVYRGGPSRRSACAAALVLLACLSAAGHAADVAPSGNLPMAIAPEGVQALERAGLPYLLMDADRAAPDLQASAPSDHSIRRIYYSVSPTVRAARDLARRDRQAASAAPGRWPSQYLTGTPLEWQRLQLRFAHPPLPSEPLLLAPGSLAAMLKDDADAQLVDLRPMPTGDVPTSFPQALRRLPHELIADPAVLSKQRWVVLVDEAGDVTPPIAETLFRAGFPLIASLRGGYRAWVPATDR